MQAFANLLDRLLLTPSRNGKLRLLEDYFRDQPDPIRGYGLAAITRDLDIRSVKPAMLRALVEERMDPILFGYSYDYVGDMAETIALTWPAEFTGINELLRLDDVVHQLNEASRATGPKLLEGWLHRLDASGRYALIKLVTGGLRIGVSSRLAKQALANFGGVDVNEIEELWHGLEPPYLPLFDWLEGRTDKPQNLAAAPFRPVMLATSFEEPDHARYEPADYMAEWKWDGIRVQVASERGVRRLYSRTGDDISGTFPDLLEAMDFEGTLDGELLVRKPLDLEPDARIEVATFSDLQQRLNRKTVSKKLLVSHPAFIRAYDLLFDGAEDLRTLPFEDRQRRLTAFMQDLDPSRFDQSEQLTFDSWDDLARHRADPPSPVIEGVMIKRRGAPYVPNRPKGEWFKWKRDPMLIDAVLMYAQRGHGKRSSFYSDYTFGVWKDEGLVPVGKAYFGFTDEELKQIDKYVRDNTVDRFGPMRAVKATRDQGLVLEVAFEGLQRSKRHKSGVAMRFPRISRLRWDKPAHEADTIENVEALLPPE
ncbi:MAG: cisplatin damage response ATP-dependent DNA ligase [Pseudomonadota bacterium]